MRQLKGFLLPVLFMLAVARGKSQGLPGESPGLTAPGARAIIILGVAHLNADCYQDSIVGFLDDEFRPVPHAIVWGRSTSSGDTSPQDASCSGVQTGPHPQRHHTVIAFPDWQSLSVSLAVERFGGDTLADFVLHMRGYEVEQDGKIVSRRVSVAVFGQQGLDGMDTINSAIIGEFQSAPFFAMQLHRGRDLIEPAARDLSGRTSWILLAPEPEQPPSPAVHPAAVAAPGAQYPVNIYPNPARNTLTVEMPGTNGARYRIELIRTNGVLEQVIDVRPRDDGKIIETLNLEQTPSGYYAVRVLHGVNVIGSWGVVVRK